MATLPAADQSRIWRGLMRYWSTARETVSGILKTDLLAAVVAADQWVDSNSNSYNNALPTTFRNNATASQKSILLVAVVLMRYNLEFLKRLFGEVD